MLVIRKPPVQPQPMQFDVARQKRIDLICEVAKIMPEAATLMCDMHPNYSVDELLDLITAQK
jgi:L-alanine-DL-glutamate epimerase-like enolase superfamily enzyme